VVLCWWSTYFWDSHPKEKNYYWAAMKALANDPAFWSRMSEYGVTGGSWYGLFDVTRFGIAATLSEQQIRDAVTFQFDNHTKPPDESTLYMILLPNGVTSITDTANNFIGQSNTAPIRAERCGF
jgi:hypothetical protein